MVQDIDILIMCSGKCGSTTLYQTFNKLGYKCLKIHSQRDYINQFKEDKLFETINNSCKNKKLIIIDSYRTPIERKISSFFQNIHTTIPNYKELSINQLINIFNNEYLYKIEEYHSINDVLNHYNLPLFKSFNHKRKYNKLLKNNKIFIKLLYKDIKDWNIILKKIFKEDINTINNNLSNKKDYYSIYNEFKQKYTVPKKYLNDLIIKDKEFIIYNTVKEQNDYLNYWLKRSI